MKALRSYIAGLAGGAVLLGNALAPAVAEAQGYKIPFGKKLYVQGLVSNSDRDIQTRGFDEGVAVFNVVYVPPKVTGTERYNCWGTWCSSRQVTVTADPGDAQKFKEYVNRYGEEHLIAVPNRSKRQLGMILDARESGQPLVIPERCALLGPIRDNIPGIPFGEDTRPVYARPNAEGEHVVYINDPDRCLKERESVPYTTEIKVPKKPGHISATGKKRQEPQY